MTQAYTKARYLAKPVKIIFLRQGQEMHYYQFNIADYRKDTAHLTLLEHGIYRQLLDSYYLDEKPIETKPVMRRLQIATDEEKKAFENVLSDFFTLSECGNFYTHKRIESEIAKYQSKVETAKANGIKGGRPKKTQSKPKKTNPVNSGLAKKTQGKANHKPITNNQEPIEKQYAFAGECIKITRDDFAELSKTYPNLDLINQLKQLDLELRDTKKWWPAMHAKLNYRNQNHEKSTRTSEPRSVVDRIRAGNAKRSAEREAALQGEWQVIDQDGAVVGTDG